MFYLLSLLLINCATPAVCKGLLQKRGHCAKAQGLSWCSPTPLSLAAAKRHLHWTAFLKSVHKDCEGPVFAVLPSALTACQSLAQSKMKRNTGAVKNSKRTRKYIWYQIASEPAAAFAELHPCSPRLGHIWSFTALDQTRWQQSVKREPEAHQTDRRKN